MLLDKAWGHESWGSSTPLPPARGPGTARRAVETTTSAIIQLGSIEVGQERQGPGCGPLRTVQEKADKPTVVKVEATSDD